MDDRELPGPVPPALRREVEPPQRQPSGLGVMLLASASMFFAVAGSAFILRARLAEEAAPVRGVAVHPYAELRRVERTRAIVLEATTAPASECTRIVSRIGPSGEQLVDFHLCPDAP